MFFLLDKSQTTPYIATCQTLFSLSTTKSKMTQKALISELTWRSLEMQRKAFPDMPHFIAPHEIASLLRDTRRNGPLDIRVLSFGVIADKEKALKEFAALCKKRNASVSSHEEAFSWLPENPVSLLVSLWRNARVRGAAKAGGRASADKRRADSLRACEKIKDLWVQPSKNNSIADLEKISGISRGTIVSILGNRTAAQYNYQAAQKRKQRRQEAGRV